MQNFSDLFYYDETSPTCLRRKVASYSGRGSSRLMVAAGDVAGYVKCGYWNVGVGRKCYQVHRIIMELHGHTLSEVDEVDHEDGDGFNNKYSNLRVVSKEVNLHNQRMYKSNSSGVTGVDWHKSKKCGTTSAVARWNEGGKQKSKFFSTRRYGLLLAFQKAIEFRKEALQQMPTYTPRHGL